MVTRKSSIVISAGHSECRVLWNKLTIGRYLGRTLRTSPDMQAFDPAIPYSGTYSGLLYPSF